MCSGINTREESILLQYSTNSGATWHLLKEIMPEISQNPRLDIKNFKIVLLNLVDFINFITKN